MQYLTRVSMVSILFLVLSGCKEKSEPKPVEKVEPKTAVKIISATANGVVLGKQPLSAHEASATEVVLEFPTKPKKLEFPIYNVFDSNNVVCSSGQITDQTVSGNRLILKFELKAPRLTVTDGELRIRDALSEIDTSIRLSFE